MRENKMIKVEIKEVLSKDDYLNKKKYSIKENMVKYYQI
jgi:hypothetical protein